LVTTALLITVGEERSARYIHVIILYLELQQRKYKHLSTAKAAITINARATYCSLMKYMVDTRES